MGYSPWNRKESDTTEQLILHNSEFSPGKESSCNARDTGDTGSIPGLGRSPGGVHGNPLQYSKASLVTQKVKNIPAVWETWV